MLAYGKRVEEFRAQYPEFDRYVGQDIPIPLSVRDELLRQPNGPDIALFLGFAPDAIEQLCKRHPLDAAKCVESISEDLERATVPREEMDQRAGKRHGIAGQTGRSDERARYGISLYFPGGLQSLARELKPSEDVAIPFRRVQTIVPYGPAKT